MLKKIKDLISKRRKNECLTILGANREFVKINRVKDALSLQNQTCLSKYFIGAKSIAPHKKDLYNDRIFNYSLR